MISVKLLMLSVTFFIDIKTLKSSVCLILFSRAQQTLVTNSYYVGQCRYTQIHLEPDKILKRDYLELE